MPFNTKLPTFNILFSLFIITCGSLGIFSYSCIARATDFNGPIELSSEKFKELNINGPSTLHAIKADTLTVNGSLNFIQLSVKGKTEISGPCSGVDGEFADAVIHGPFEGTKINSESLHVDGPTALEDFKIKGNVKINGPLKAKVGSFKNIDSVQTPVALYDVKVNNINVPKDSRMNKDDNADNDGYAKNNEIKLAGKTIVSGDITFESGNGIVFIRDKTAQFKGKVIGGKIKE